MSWTAMETRAPGTRDGDRRGRVLVWHRMGGAMIVEVEHARNRFVSHWQATPDRTNRRWRRTEERPPGRGDGDAQGCVLAWGHGAEIVHWSRVRKENGYLIWMRTPGKPEEGDEDGSEGKGDQGADALPV